MLLKASAVLKNLHQRTLKKREKDYSGENNIECYIIVCYIIVSLGILVNWFVLKKFGMMMID